MAGRSRPPELPPGFRLLLQQILFVVFAFGLEVAMFVLFLLSFNETMGFLTGSYLCDLPVVGPPFCAIDEDLTGSHVLCGLLAFFCVAVPVAIWLQIYRERILDDPQAWFARPANRLKAIVAGLLLALAVGLEVTNLYTLIARESAGSPFGVPTSGGNPLMDALADKQALGVVVSIVIATVNIVIAAITARAAYALKGSFDNNRLMSAAAGLILLGGTLGAPAPAMAAQPTQAVFVVIETGGTVQDREQATELVGHVLNELSLWRRQRGKKHAQIHLIVTDQPTEVRWSGTPQQLHDQGAWLMQEVLAFRASCSDLVRAWDQAAVTARITRPDKMALIQIGPAIHAGYPCDSGEPIALPQPVPTGLKLTTLAQKANLLRWVGVHPDQDELLLDHVENSGLMKRVEAGELDFDLFGPARARAHAGALLGGRR